MLRLRNAAPEFPLGGIERGHRKVEERDCLPAYKLNKCYPVRIGAVINDLDQVVSNLGSGML